MEVKMTSVTVFLGLASKLLPEFDRSADNLQRFIDAVMLVDTTEEGYETTAVELIKTKLKGNVRNQITTETSISQIVNKLKSSIKGESVEVLTAKLNNIKRNSKTANVYTKEVEDITKSLENAYITDGLSSTLAEKYATQAAVKAMAKNSNNEKTKIIIESGNFANMNELISKFVNSSNESRPSQQNTVLYYRQQNRYPPNRGRGRGYHNNGLRGGAFNTYSNRNNYNNNRNTTTIIVTDTDKIINDITDVQLTI